MSQRKQNIPLPVNHNLNERVTSVETSLLGIQSQLASFGETLAAIQSELKNNGRTNWPTIFGGLALLGGLWAASIRPVSQDIERQGRSAETLAAAVVEQNKQIAELRISVASAKANFDHLQPTAESQLAVIQWRLDNPERDQKN